MQSILSIVLQLTQLMMSQFQGGGFSTPFNQNPFQSQHVYDPRQSSPFNYFGNTGLGGGAYLV